MPDEVQGVVATAKGKPVVTTTIVVPDPGPGEAKVRIQACGVCHTDLHYRRRRDQRRLPLPPRARGGRRGRRRRARCHRRCARRLRDPQLASGLRRMSGMPARSALVLLQHPQCVPADDPRRRHTALPRARHRGLRREDVGGRRPVHQGGPVGPARGRRSAGLWGHGRARCGHAHRRGRLRRLGGRLRMRRCWLRGGSRRPPGRCHPDHRHRPRRSQARAGPTVRSHPHGGRLGCRPRRAPCES